jgi:hypothetical protein
VSSYHVSDVLFLTYFRAALAGTTFLDLAAASHPPFPPSPTSTTGTSAGGSAAEPSKNSSSSLIVRSETHPVSTAPPSRALDRGKSGRLRVRLARDDALLLELAKVVEDQLGRCDNFTPGLKLHDD